jgi:hypothetical protein
MRTINLLGVLAVSIGLYAGQRDPADPFPNHEEPEAGYYCHPANSARDEQTNDHACACLGMRDDPMCPKPGETEPPGDLESPREPNDNPKCKAYCHVKHCSCKVNCATT